MFDAAFTRRLFLQRGCALASMAATVPCFIERSALGILGDPLLSSQPGVPDERPLRGRSGLGSFQSRMVDDRAQRPAQPADRLGV